jgi:hypothetical protein
MRGLVDHFLEVQEKQMHSDTGLFFTDERIIAQLVETIDAGYTKFKTFYFYHFVDRNT